MHQNLSENILIFCLGKSVILIQTNNTGNKDAYKYPDNILDYHTSLSRYGFKIDNSVTFLIKACNNAFVSLCRSKQMSSKENYYEIAFGSDHNFKLRIRRFHQQVESYKLMHAGVLDCYEYKAFWISWINGSISIGKGVDRCQNEVLSWHDPNSFSIKSIGVMTGYGSTGEWLVLSYTGKIYLFITQLITVYLY
ncbi:unnamed protein product [Mytilus edulis]|uniref:Farnesoic acid O-methyl transferase domain-containing protein n=1 Tax=Mytilus edulis TaxID=6550 RepID=A0A8S3QP29_MYTED|nr:unnamed protein product [Mytilus edulis]